jgi:hypothetical protein
VIGAIDAVVFGRSVPASMAEKPRLGSHGTARAAKLRH